MSQREKILAAVVLLLVLGWGGTSLYGRYQSALDLRESELADAQEQLALLKLSIKRGEQAVRQMEVWRQRSLPDNREKAFSLYKAWLLDKAKQAGLTVEDINPPLRTTPSSSFTAIGYRTEAKGSLSAVAAMLYEFYRSPQLHQITKLQLTRPLGAGELQVSLEAEALILPGADASEGLPQGESKRLKLASLADYQKTLTERDLTNVYTPPRPPGDTAGSAPTPPAFDDSDHAYFSGSVGIGDKYQAWIHVRTTGETLHLYAGDSFKVGQVEGQIVSVEPRSLVYQTGDKKYRVSLDQTLRKGTELGADGKAASDTKPEEPKS